MRDFPVFTTEYGVASLILREIPYRAIAYIRIHSAQEPDALIAECAGFCRAAGAERVFASGHPELEKYPLYTAVWQMHCPRDSLPDTDAALWPVQEATLEEWRGIYNRRMADVPNSAWLTLEGAKEMLMKGDGYFVHRGQTLLGIGRASGERMDAVISCAPGAGQQVVLALTHAISEANITLEVASANSKAVRLYEGLGFVPTAELSRWYEIP